jgi:hypothetical protein
VPDPDPTTQELRALQSKRKEGEVEAARDAPTEEGERSHRRRAENAAYLEEKLAEQERADDS